MGVSRILSWFDARSCAYINTVALLLLLVISILDFTTPPAISTSVFYMIPIAVAAWFGGRGSGLLMAFLATLAWTGKDIGFRGYPYAEQAILFWNTATRLIMFSVVSWLITEVRRYVRREEQLARTDQLTGLLNARTLHEELEHELARSARSDQPVSFLYFDLDHFKQVNDGHGHAEGDRVLRVVADVLRHELRRIDVIGRLGGDEFAVILPSTDPLEARAVISKLQAKLKDEMARHGWPITFSSGAITCLAPVASAEALVTEADRLMYEVKTGGKDAFLHRTWS